MFIRYLNKDEVSKLEVTKAKVYAEKSRRGFRYFIDIYLSETIAQSVYINENQFKMLQSHYGVEDIQRSFFIKCPVFHQVCKNKIDGSEFKVISAVPVFGYLTFDVTLAPEVNYLISKDVTSKIKWNPMTEKEAEVYLANETDNQGADL